MEKAYGKQPRILIADDLQKNIQVIGTILRKEGFQINVAVNGKQALDLAEKTVPDLILMDIMMPGGDGIETCRKLKEHRILKKIPIIFISAKSEPKDILRGFEVGGSDYVLKPFNSNELLARVKNHLEVKFYREMLEKLSYERQELIHILCHDLSNPIVGILGVLEILEEVDNFEEAKKYFSYLDKGAKNAYGIIELVRKLEKLDKSDFNLDLQLEKLTELIDECVGMIYLKSEKKSLKIITNISEEHEVLVERTSFINSVLMNILTNSIKFSNPGGTINISSQKVENQIFISFKDEGIGMNQKTLESIFQIENLKSRRGTAGETGTGFGMPLIKKFLGKYGGSISIYSSDSKEKHGTEVVIGLKASKV
ncbi:MAG: hypothetical protein CME68_02810 [Halobacteriovoraceae bacterium]|nr:hypothetical protein [Halobacteriovoraceae bacterium]